MPRFEDLIVAIRSSNLPEVNSLLEEKDEIVNDEKPIDLNQSAEGKTPLQIALEKVKEQNRTGPLNKESNAFLIVMALIRKQPAAATTSKTDNRIRTIKKAALSSLSGTANQEAMRNIFRLKRAGTGTGGSIIISRAVTDATKNDEGTLLPDLIQAIRESNFECVDSILISKRDLDLNQPPDEGESLLEIALAQVTQPFESRDGRTDNHKILESLVKHGAKVKPKDIDCRLLHPHVQESKTNSVEETRDVRSCTIAVVTGTVERIRQIESKDFENRPLLLSSTSPAQKTALRENPISESVLVQALDAIPLMAKINAVSGHVDLMIQLLLGYQKIVYGEQSALRSAIRIGANSAIVDLIKCGARFSLDQLRDSDDCLPVYPGRRMEYIKLIQNALKNRSVQFGKQIIHADTTEAEIELLRTYQNEMYIYYFSYVASVLIGVTIGALLINSDEIIIALIATLLPLALRLFADCVDRYANPNYALASVEQKTTPCCCFWRATKKPLADHDAIQATEMTETNLFQQT